MEMQIRVYGSGLSYRGVGVNFGKEAHLLFRNAPDEGVLALAMRDNLDIANEHSTVAFVSHLGTQWFPVNVSAHEWLFDIHELVGRFAELKVTGGAMGNVDGARVGVELLVRDKFHEVAEKLSVGGVPVIDYSFSFGTFHIGAELEREEADKVAVYDAEGNGRYRPTIDSLEP